MARQQNIEDQKIFSNKWSIAEMVQVWVIFNFAPSTSGKQLLASMTAC
jgi:hypothetical protein